MLANILVVCEILDRLGSPNPLSAMPLFELKFSGPKTTESVALEKSLRNVVRRFQELEQQVSEQKSEAAVKRIFEAGQIDENISAPLGTILFTPPKEATSVETARPPIPAGWGPESRSSSYFSLTSIDEGLKSVSNSPTTHSITFPLSDPSLEYLVIQYF